MSSDSPQLPEDRSTVPSNSTGPSLDTTEALLKLAQTLDQVTQRLENICERFADQPSVETSKETSARTEVEGKQPAHNATVRGSPGPSVKSIPFHSHIPAYHANKSKEQDDPLCKKDCRSGRSATNTKHLETGHSTTSQSMKSRRPKPPLTKRQDSKAASPEAASMKQPSKTAKKKPQGPSTITKNGNIFIGHDEYCDCRICSRARLNSLNGAPHVRGMPHDWHKHFCRECGYLLGYPVPNIDGPRKLCLACLLKRGKRPE